jgi:hypothetical protein
MATIIFYMTLSIYRIDKSTTNYAVFIMFAILNSIYTSFWDVYYDWSLGDPNAKHRFLRQTLGYKHVWMYYVAIIIDPILRFNWICYAITPLHIQHSALTSFFVSLSEIFRRGLWSLFRVENEHCSNVGHFRASRDVPLPYDIPSSPGTSDRPPQGKDRFDEEAPPPAFRRVSTLPTLDLGPHASGTDAAQRTSSSRRRRANSLTDPDPQGRPSPLTRGLTRMGSIMRNAHAQDFEKRKKPELGAGPTKDDDTDDEDEDEHMGSASVSGGASQNGDSGDQSESEIMRVREEVSIGMAGGSGSGSGIR